MKTILHIAGDAIRALLHQRLLMGLMLATLALTLFFCVTLNMARTQITGGFIDQAMTNNPASTNQLSEVDQRQLRESLEMASSGIQAAFYGVASFGGSIIALFIFSTTLASEIRKGTIRVTLSKPVSRPQYLLGKYLGGVVVMFIYTVTASLAMVLFAESQTVELSPAIRFAPWLMFCRQLMLGSVAMVLSLFMHPLVASVVAFFASDSMLGPPNPLYFILPSYGRFNVVFQVMMGSLIEVGEVFLLSLYALDFVVIMLLLALWRFHHKDLV